MIKNLFVVNLNEEKKSISLGNKNDPETARSDFQSENIDVE